MGKRYRRKGGLPGLPRLCRGRWAKERQEGNDRKQTWGSDTKLPQNARAGYLEGHLSL